MKINRVAVSGLVGLTTFSFLFLSSSVSFADGVITTTTVNITESCTLTGTTNTAHAATLLNGTYSGTDYSNGIGQTTLKAFCNDSGGFAIYAIGYTNEEYGNTTMHWSGAVNASDNTNAIATGIYTSGSTVNSTWSMKLASVAGTYAATIANGTNNTENFTTWHEIPDEYTKVAYRDSGTDIEINGSGTGSSITVTYDSYISAGQPAGSYVGKVKYTLVHPATHAAPVTEYIMQDVANWKDSLSIGDEVQAIDSRDNKVYYVAKLADGNIWMTQNLDHDIGDIAGGTYTSSDTDLPANTSWTPSASEETHATNDTTWDDGSHTVPESYDPGDLCWTGDFNTDWDGTLTTETESCTQNGNHYHIGNYYNWTAAVAMRDSSSYTTPETDVNQSICPAGWMLPKGGTILTGSGSFVYLFNEYGYSNDTLNDYTAWGEPLRFTLGGWWDEYYSRLVATLGIYWASVVFDDAEAYTLYVDSFGAVNPLDGSDYRYCGRSVRCVVRPD